MTRSFNSGRSWVPAWSQSEGRIVLLSAVLFWNYEDGFEAYFAYLATFELCFIKHTLATIMAGSCVPGRDWLLVP
jgi:hypothetical protein